MSARSTFLLALALCIGVAPLSAQRATRGRKFAEIDLAILDGIRQGTYPGAVVVVGRGDSILYAKGYGRITWRTIDRKPDPATTLWDLASLSKVVGTASAAAVLVDQGRLQLDAPVSRYLPEFSGGAKDSVTVRMLLNHTSGLPAWAPIWRMSRTPDEARAALYSIPLVRAPGLHAEYSDLNALLVGLVVSKVSGTSLDAFARDAVFAPLGMGMTMYQPEAADRTRAVPTRKSEEQSKRGIVNDENARAFDGIAGHAGIFSTGLDLARFAQGWLTDSTQTRLAWLHPIVREEFLTRSPNGGSRALGWDTPREANDGGPSLYGRCATSGTVGHTGWTGTALWIDPAADLFVILLTNRSYAPRNPAASFEQIRLIRARVSDAARRALGGCK
ncbi:MAG: serine hydrolase domain-containing protein [Gemmatimonadota bacterium]